MFDENIYQQIELYLAGKLSGNDLTTFEQKLAADAEFAELVENHFLMSELIKGQHLAEVKGMMDADFEAGKVESSTNKKWWLFGGLVLTGALLYVGINSQNSTESTKVIINEKPEIGVVSVPQKTQQLKEVKPIAHSETSKTITTEKEKISSNQTKVVTKQPVEIHKPQAITEPLPVINEKPEKVVTKSQSEKNSVELVTPKVEVKCAIEAKALILAEPTCASETTGLLTIEIQYVKNAKQPYQFKAIDSYGHSIIQKNLEFRSLASEFYTVSLLDADNCSIELAKEVFVDIKECNQRETQSFNPNYGEVFEFPIPKEEDAMIVFYSRYGKEVFAAAINNNSKSWNGKNDKGETVEAGLYIYKITYKKSPQEIGEVLVY